MVNESTAIKALKKISAIHNDENYQWDSVSEANEMGSIAEAALAALKNESQNNYMAALMEVIVCLEEAPVDFIGTSSTIGTEKEAVEWYAKWRAAVEILNTFIVPVNGSWIPLHLWDRQSVNVIVAYKFGVAEAKYVGKQFVLPHDWNTEFPEVTHVMELPIHPNKEL